MPTMEPPRDAIGNVPEPIADLFREFEMEAPMGCVLSASDLPAEARGLLAHAHGMTLMLERAYADTLRLETLRSHQRDARLTRHVLLMLERSGRPVAMALIHIHLEHLPDAARRLVLEQTVPFGRILKDCGIAHASEPQAYFQIAADSVRSDRLVTVRAATLYGRRVLLTGTNGRPLAEAIEMLF